MARGSCCVWQVRDSSLSGVHIQNREPHDSARAHGGGPCGQLGGVVSERGSDRLHKHRAGDYEIRIRPNATGLTLLTHSPGNDAHAAWSPDGKWIAFSSGRGGFNDELARGGGQPRTDLFVMRADGTDVRRLKDDAAEEGTLTFPGK